MRAASLGTRGRPVAYPSVRVSAGVGRMLALGVVVCLAAGLRFASLSGVPNNLFYDAAVRSMSLSWHNFFFAAFEPGARVAIDKPPVDLWLQVASVKLFGFNSYALKLPQALAGTAAIVLLYDFVRRLFGAKAGLVSALALAVLPITVLTSRSDTMDTLMMALMVLAAWLVVRAAETGRARYLYAAAAVMGVDFNVKLFEALLAVPALAALYLLGTRLPGMMQLRRAAAATLVLATVALSWPLAVTVAPVRDKPYPLGSTNGSVWNSIFVFDGLDRLGSAHRPGHRRGEPHAPPPPSAKRLFAPSAVGLDRQVGSELLPALVFGFLALAAAALARRRAWIPQLRRDRLKNAGTVALAVWLVIGAVGFSAMGRLHVRYLEAFSPAIAAALGAGLVVLAGASNRPRTVPFLGLATALCLAYAAHLSRHEPTLRAFILCTGIAALLCSLVLLVEPPARDGDSSRNSLPVAITVLVALSLLAVPASESLAIVRHHKSDATTELAQMRPRRAARLSRYLIAHQGGARDEVATRNPWQASPLIVSGGRPVLIFRNVNGHALVSTRELSATVRAGQLKYVLLGPRCSRAHARHLKACRPLARWVRSHGSRVERTGRKVGLWRVHVGPAR